VRDLPVGDLPARLYVPRTPDPEPGPLLVFFHGGGFMYGDLDSHDATCRLLAERGGVRVLAIDYRLAPEHPFPAAHDDALAAYRWVVRHADVLGADPQRLAVGGDSAGGTLAAATAIAAATEGLPLAFQLLVYPSVDARRDTRSLKLFSEGFYLTQAFMDLANASYVPDTGVRGDIRVSPLRHDVPDGLAPAYICTAGFDPLRDEGEAYARARRGRGAGAHAPLPRPDPRVLQRRRRRATLAGRGARDRRRAATLRARGWPPARRTVRSADADPRPTRTRR